MPSGAARAAAFLAFGITRESNAPRAIIASMPQTWMLIAGGVAVGVLILLSLVQRCPHCAAFVRRARSRRWLRCRRCGRQYNATVGTLKS
jgi:tRNA(Ile2) C34 agmatinyltransferase TiaS